MLHFFIAGINYDSDSINLPWNSSEAYFQHDTAKQDLRRFEVW